MDVENSCSMRWVTRKMYQCTLSDNALEKSRHGASPPMCVSDVTGSWAPRSQASEREWGAGTER